MVQINALRESTTAVLGFEGDTLVHVQERNEHGESLKSIEFIEVGDRVLSRCEKTGALAYKRVTRVLANGFHCVYGIGFEFGPDVPSTLARLPGMCVIYVAPEHLFHRAHQNWTRALDLKIGDAVTLFNGTQAKVAEIRRDMKYCDIFTIEVEEFHNHFIHWSGIWVRRQNMPNLAIGPQVNDGIQSD